jgi:hypothetical protein
LLAFGLAMLLIGWALVPGAGGWAAVGIGGIATVGSLASLVPGAAYVRFSPLGLTVKYAFQSARTVPWPQVAGVTSELVPLIRHQAPSLVVTYAPGYSDSRVGQRLDDDRSYVGNFTTASGEQLEATARDYLARYGG